MHNIFGNRFFSLRQKPWHNLGVISQDEMTATDAYNLTQPITIVLQDIHTSLPSLQDPEHRPTKHQLDYRAIVRYPTPDDPEYRTFGIVSPSYTLVDPLTFCEAFDDAVKQPVETIGTLGKGDTLFISTKLPTFDIKGDEVENYLLTVSPYKPGIGIEARITPVRTVCQNTLIAARRQSVQSFSIRHDKNVLERTRTWLAAMAGKVEEKSTDLIRSFTKLADTPVPQAYLDQLLGGIYPEPKPSAQAFDSVTQGKRDQWHEENQTSVRRSRGLVKEIFEGRGVGMDTVACEGTAWGLFNAVCEFEEFRPSRSLQTSSSDILFGLRRDTMERAYSVLWDFALKGK